MKERFKRKTIDFLRWSEQYTKTDMTYLAKGGGWLTIGQIIQNVAALILAIAFANLVPQEIYGSYKYLISLAGIIGIFTLTGLRTAITQAVARGFEGSLKWGFEKMMQWNFGLITVALCCAGYYYLQGNADFAIGMLFVAIFYPILKSSELYQNFLEGIKDFKHRSIYLAVWEIVEVGSLLTALYFTNNLLIILLAFFASNAIAPLLFYYLTLKKHHPNHNIDPETLPYSKHLSVINGFNSVAKQLDKVLVFQFIGPAQLAVYSFATLPVEKARSFLGPIQTLALPKFSANSAENLKKTLPYKVLLFFGICVAAVVVFIIALPFLFELLFPQYLDSIPYAQLYSLIFLLFPAVLFDQALTAQAKEKALYKISVGENVAKIGSILILLPLYGIWGGVVALLLTKIVRATMSIFCFYRM